MWSIRHRSALVRAGVRTPSLPSLLSPSLPLPFVSAAARSFASGTAGRPPSSSSTAAANGTKTTLKKSKKKSQTGKEAVAEVGSVSSLPASARPSLPPAARHLYRSLLRTAAKYDRCPVLKAALVHPANNGLHHYLHEQALGADGDGEGGSDGLPNSQLLRQHIWQALQEAQEKARLNPGQPLVASIPLRIPAHNPFSSHTEPVYTGLPKNVNLPLSQKLFFKWLDRFFRRPVEPIIKGAPYPATEASSSRRFIRKMKGQNGGKEGTEAANSAATTTSSSSTSAAAPAPTSSSPATPRSRIPMYYLPSRSLVASVRREFRAFTLAPTPAQWGEMLSGGFQVLRYLTEHELREFEPDEDPLTTTGAELHIEEEYVNTDPAVMFSPFAPPFMGEGHETDLMEIDGPDSDPSERVRKLSEEKRKRMRMEEEQAKKKKTQGKANTIQKGEEGVDQETEQWEVDLDAIQADIKHEQQQKGQATATSSAQPATSTAPVTSTTTSSSTTAAPTPASSSSSSFLPSISPSSIPPPPGWSLRRSPHLRVGSFLVSHPALSTPELHQTVILITKFDEKADKVEGIIVNRPLEEAIRRSRRNQEEGEEFEEEEARNKFLTARASTTSTSAMLKDHELTSNSLFSMFRSAANPVSSLHPSSSSSSSSSPRNYDLAALDAMFPNAILYGGPIRQEDGHPLILHRRKDWRMKTGGEGASRIKRHAFQPPILPALSMHAPDGSGKAVEVAPPVYIGSWRRWASFLREAEAHMAKSIREEVRADKERERERRKIKEANEEEMAAENTAAAEQQPTQTEASTETPASKPATQSDAEPESESAAPTWPTSAVAGTKPAGWTTLSPSNSNSLHLPLTAPPSPFAPASDVDWTSSLDAPLRVWDFLLVFGYNQWSVTDLQREIDEGTWFLMEGNSKHVFMQHVDEEGEEFDPEEEEDKEELDEDMESRAKQEWMNSDEQLFNFQQRSKVQKEMEEQEAQEKKEGEEKKIAPTSEPAATEPEAASATDTPPSVASSSTYEAELEAQLLADEEADRMLESVRENCSSPAITQPVYASIMAKREMDERVQKEAGVTPTEDASEPALVPPASVLSSSLPPVLFPWQRLWHHAMFQLGGEGRHWAYLPESAFEEEPEMDEQEDDDDDFPHEEEEEDEWDDDHQPDEDD